MVVGTMKLLWAFIFHNNGMKGSNEDKSKRGGARIYVIVAVDAAISIGNLNSFPIFSTENMRKNRNRR
jgi:hypothetical protein